MERLGVGEVGGRWECEERIGPISIYTDTHPRDNHRERRQLRHNPLPPPLPPPPPPSRPTPLQIAGPGILRRGGTGRSDLKDRHSTSSPRQQIRRHCDHCRGRCYSFSSRPPTLSPRVGCVRRGTQHLASLSIASVALTYLFTGHLPQSQCRKVCSVEELETLPAGIKPRTPHHRSPGGERGRGSERQSSLNWR